jgi:hypothetical protein
MKLKLVLLLFLLAKVVSGQSVFQKTYELNPLISNNSSLKDAIIKDNQNVFAIGSYKVDVINKGQLTISKLDFDGNIYWIKNYEYPYSISPINIIWNSDSTMSILCYSLYPSGSNQWDYLLLKVDTLGNILNNHLLKSATIENGKLIRTKDNNLAIGGLMRDSNNIYSISLLKIDTSGNLIFSYQYSCPSILGIGANMMLEDNMSNLYFTGYELDSIGYANAAIFKLDSAGNILSNRVYVFPDYNGLSFGVFSDNKIVAAGSKSRLPTVQDALLLIVDTGLNLINGKRYYTNGASFNITGVYHFDTDTTILLKKSAGSINIDFEGNILSSEFYAVAVNSIANNIIKHDKNYLFVGSANVPERCYLVKTDSSFHSNCYEGSASILDSSFNTLSTYSLNIIKNPYTIIQVDTLTFSTTIPVVNTTNFCFGYTGLDNNLDAPLQTNIAYPNPFKDNISFNSSGFNTIEIYDLNGKLLKAIPTNGTATLQVDLAILSPGVYVAAFKSLAKTSFQKIIKID